MNQCKNMLVIGNFNAGALEHYYIRGFHQQGVAVDTYEESNPFYEALGRNPLNRLIHKIQPNTFYKDINTGLLQFLKGRHYDAILVFKGMELFPGTVASLKDHCRLLCNYNPDHPFVYFYPGSGNANVRNSIGLYDLHFSYAKSIVKRLQNDFGKQAYCIPFGFDDAVKSNTQEAPDPSFHQNFLFIGAYDPQRAAYLNMLHSSQLRIYGNSKWNSRNLLRPRARQAYQGRSLYNNDYVAAITGSAGIINLLRKQNLIEGSHNMRTFEVPGYGGLLISERTPEQSDYFEEDKEAVYFSTAAELEKKMAWLSARPEKVHEMKQAAYDRSLRSGYSYAHRSQQLLNCIVTNL